MTVYRIGGKPAEHIGRMLGVKGKATLAEYATKPGDCYTISAFASEMKVEVDVTRAAENEACDPRDFVVTALYLNPPRECVWKFADCQQIASENAALADPHFRECIARDFAYRVGVAQVSFLSEDYAYLRGIGRKYRRI